MAGSYKHIIDEEGNLITNEEFIGQIENLGDAYEMAEECWYLIQILSDGDQDKIEKASKTIYKMLNQKGNNRNEDLLKFLIGMNKEDGSNLCKENGYIFRVVREDSHNYIVTMDLRFDRVNLQLDNGVITKYNIG